MTIGPVNTQQAYLPPEFDLPKDQTSFYDFISKRERLTATIINIKENSQYEKREILTGQQYFDPNAPTRNQPYKTQYTFRLTFDLVALNGGNIPNGTKTINLQNNPAINVPTLISYANGLIPVHGFGAATSGTTFYFVNDPQLYVRFVNTSTIAQSIVITNSTGNVMTQFYWVMEYIKT